MNEELPNVGNGLSQADMRKYEDDLINMSFIYLIEEEEQYAQKTVELLKRLFQADSWESDYLGLVELCAGVSIAYDWCYDYIKEKEVAQLI